MNGNFQFLRPLCDSHLLGLLFAVLAFVGMADVAVAAAMIPAGLGFGWQANLLAATPLLCVLGCLSVSILAPVGNRSRFTLVRGIGRIPILGRYLVFVVVGLGTVLLMASFMYLFVFSSVQSLELRGDVPFETSTRIREEVGRGVTFQWAGDETKVFFLEEKRAAVERAIKKESLVVED